MGDANLSWKHDPRSGVLTATLTVLRPNGAPLTYQASANIAAIRAQLVAKYGPRLRGMLAHNPSAVAGALQQTAMICASAGCAAELASRVGEGWDLKKPDGSAIRVTTDDAKALVTYLAKGTHFLRDSSKEKQAALEASFYANRARIASDPKFAGEQWARIARNNRNWIKDHYGPTHSLLHNLGEDAKAVIKNPVQELKNAGSTLAKNPALLALAPIIAPLAASVAPVIAPAVQQLAMSEIKPLRGIRDTALSTLAPIPGVAQALHTLDSTVDAVKANKPINAASVAKNALGAIAKTLPIDVGPAIKPLTQALGTAQALAARSGVKTGTVLNAATSVVQKLKAGDKNTVAAVKNIVAKAAAGAPDAAHAVSLLEQLAKPMKLPGAAPVSLPADLLRALNQTAAAGCIGGTRTMRVWNGHDWVTTLTRGC